MLTKINDYLFMDLSLVRLAFFSDNYQKCSFIYDCPANEKDLSELEGEISEDFYKALIRYFGETNED